MALYCKRVAGTVTILTCPVEVPAQPNEEDEIGSQAFQALAQ